MPRGPLSHIVSYTRFKPQIGEVAGIVNRLRARIAGRTIREVKVTPNAASALFKTPPAEIQEFMTGRQVTDVKQWGSQFWWEMERAPHFRFDLGMAGWMECSDVLDDHADHTAARPWQKPDWPPVDYKFIWKFEDTDVEVALTDPFQIRRRAQKDTSTVKMWDTEDVNVLRGGGRRIGSKLMQDGVQEVGLDPMQEVVELEELTEALKKRPWPIKYWLVSDNIAGIGSWVSDEILFQAEIHPDHETDKLPANKIAMLRNAIRYVTRTAVKHEGVYRNMPPKWLLHQRYRANKHVNKWSKSTPAGQIDVTWSKGAKCVYIPRVQVHPDYVCRVPNHKAPVASIPISPLIRKEMIKPRFRPQEDKDALEAWKHYEKKWPLDNLFNAVIKTGNTTNPEKPANLPLTTHQKDMRRLSLRLLRQTNRASSDE